MVLGSGGQQQKQGPPTVPAWHPLEDLGSHSQDEAAGHEGKLSPAEGARTVIETNEDGILFTSMFPEGFSEGLDLFYAPDQRGDIYFEVDGSNWMLEDLRLSEHEDVTIVVGYNEDDDSEMMMDEESDLSDYLLSDSDSESESDSDSNYSDEDFSNEEHWKTLDEYLTILRSRGVQVDDISPESFGTLGAYGGFDTLENVHPLDFSMRISDAVDAQREPEVELPQAKVILRGVVELVSGEEERRVRREWVARGYAAREAEAHDVAVNLLEELARLQEEGHDNEAQMDDVAAQAARKRADAALEQLRKDLQRPETRAGGFARAASFFDTMPLEEDEAESVEVGVKPPKDPPDLYGGSPGNEGREGSERRTSGNSAESPPCVEKPKFDIKGLLRRRLEDLDGFNGVAKRIGRGGKETQGSEHSKGAEKASGSGSEVIERTGAGSAEWGEKGADHGCRQADSSAEGERASLHQDESVADGPEVSGNKHSEQPQEMRTEPGLLPEPGSCPTTPEAEIISREENEQSSCTNSRQDRGAEASTSGSEAQAPGPTDIGGVERWLGSVAAESPIVWDQNTGRLWLGSRGASLFNKPGEWLANGTQGLQGLLWGDEETDIDAIWRVGASDYGEEEEVQEEGQEEGPPLYRLKVTSVCFKSPTGSEWQIDASKYAAAKPDVLCEASATLLEQVNHAGHKVARGLVRLCKRTLGIEVDDAAMVAVDRYGFDVRVSQGIEMKTMRLPFPEEAVDEHHAMLLLEDMIFLNKKQDRKLLQLGQLPPDDLGSYRET